MPGPGARGGSPPLFAGSGGREACKARADMQVQPWPSALYLHPPLNPPPPPPREGGEHLGPGPRPRAFPEALLHPWGGKSHLIRCRGPCSPFSQGPDPGPGVNKELKQIPRQDPWPGSKGRNLEGRATCYPGNGRGVFRCYS